MAPNQVDDEVLENCRIVKYTLNANSLSDLLDTKKLQSTKSLNDLSKIVLGSNVADRPNIIITGTATEDLDAVVNLDRGIPVVAIQITYEPEEIRRCFSNGAFDVVFSPWAPGGKDYASEFKKQLKLALRKAYNAGLQLYESGGGSSLETERKKLGYATALVPKKDTGTPKTSELLARLSNRCYRVLPAREKEHFEALVHHVSPDLSLIITSVLDGKTTPETIENIIKDHLDHNPASNILFISDGEPPQYMLSALEDHGDIIFYYQRPSNLVFFDHTLDSILTSIKTGDHIDSIENSGNALLIGMGYYREWVSLRESGSDPKKLERYRRDAVAALSRFRNISVQESGARTRTLTIKVEDMECAEGVVEIVDPTEDYGDTSELRYIIKRTKEGHQAYDDWINFFAEGRPFSDRKDSDKKDFRTALIYNQPLPIDDNYSFILQQCIIGPNSAEVLRKIKETMHSDTNTQRLKDNAQRLRDIIVSHRIGEFLFWRENMPSLTSTSQGRFTVQDAIDAYVNRWVDLFKNVNRYTDASVPPTEIENAEEAIRSYPWKQIVKQDTLMRYFSSTFRNSIIKTGWIDIPIPELVATTADSKGEVSRKKLRSRMYSVDHAAKDGHYLEDVFELLYFYEANLNAEERSKYYKKIRNTVNKKQPDFMPSIDDQTEAIVMAAFRNSREASLFLGTYWPNIVGKLERVVGKLERGTLSKEEFERKKEEFERKRKYYIDVINYHLKHARDLTSSLSSENTLSSLKGPLESCIISELKYINGGKNGS